jgi:ATP-dependent helicase YprA (DUF1998 family)
MNALVEDQMHRLRQILFWINLSCHGSRGRAPSRMITFGRYTGNTPTDSNDRDPERQPSDEAMENLGEILYRSEMQAAPPDILVTNFTMLEYTLLRGDDQRLFHRPELFRFLALDEIHTYSGTQGMEVALLLRRLRAFLNIRAGRNVGFRAIGTSATLPSGTEAAQKTARFASTLFGVPFDPEDVVRPEPIQPLPVPNTEPSTRSQLADDLANLSAHCPDLAAFLGSTKKEPRGTCPKRTGRGLLAYWARRTESKSTRQRRFGFVLHKC